MILSYVGKGGVQVRVCWVLPCKSVNDQMRYSKSNCSRYIYQSHPMTPDPAGHSAHARVGLYCFVFNAIQPPPSSPES